MTLDGIKIKEDFIKNLYSHYLEGPVNKVLAFQRPARTCAQYAWSPYVYTILNFPPRIIQAYFAKKVVVKKNNQLSCFFKRIDSKHPQKDTLGINNLPYDAILGREVYLVIETLDLQEKELVCQLLPSTSTMTGNTNKLGLMANNLQVEDHKPIVGNFTALENNAHSSAHYTNLKKHHSDKAFLKLYLRPQSRATFDTWSTNLNNSVADNKMVNMEISVKLSSPGEVYFGDKGHGIGVFLTEAKEKFRVVNRTVYEIFEPNNNYNYLQLAAGGADRLIGKIINKQDTQVVYFYHDENDNEHFFGQFDIIITQRQPIDPLHPNDLIKMVDATGLAEYNKNEVHIRFLTINSPRHFIDIDCFSGLLGAMAINNTYDLGFNGFSDNTGLGGGHLNGLMGDLRYLRTDFTGGLCWLSDIALDYNRQRAFNNALFDYGWGRSPIYLMLSEFFDRGGNLVILPHCNHYHRTIINTHEIKTKDVNLHQTYPQEVTEAVIFGAVIYQVGDQLNTGDVVRHDHHLHIVSFDSTSILDIIN